MSLSISVNQQLHLANTFHNFLVVQSPKGTYNPTLRNSLFIAFSDLVLEHYGAIVTLVQSAQHHGSALALLRPIYETSHRAFWTFFSAKDEKLERIAKGTTPFPAIAICSREVEKHFASQGYKGLFTMSREYLNQLHGLTHSGIEQLQFRFNSDGIVTPTYPDKTLCGLLRQASEVVALTSLFQLEFIEGNSTHQNRITCKYIELFGEATNQ